MSTPKAGHRLLVVDDEPVARLVTIRMLEHAGYEVIEAESGLRALELAVLNPGISCAVVDVVMPNMDGITVRDRLKDVLPGCEVLLVSGFTMPEALTPPADAHFLSKPFSDEQLTGKVRSLVGP